MASGGDNRVTPFFKKINKMSKTIFITEKINFKFLLSSTAIKNLSKENGVKKLSDICNRWCKTVEVEYKIDKQNYITLFNIDVLDANFYVDLINR